MKNIVNSYVKKFTEEHRKTRKAVALLLALAMVVATGVSWQLHATGIALTNETYCGLEEHTHSEDCYETVLTCGLEESEGHTHTEDCYETETVLVCGKEESEGHTHTEDCYDADGSLICGQEESEGHTHSDSCYETETTLVCNQEEFEGHTHSDACYEEQLVCGLEEHTHTVDCLTDVTADVETAADWEATLPDLTGDWAADLVAVAQSQLGYAESTANFTLADDGTTRQGYTRYGAWYGNAYGAWDAMFVSFCLSYAGIPEESVPQAAGAYAWTATLSGFDCYTTDGDYTPAAGDIAFFDADGDGAADGVGIVSNVSGANMTVVQGDSGDQVAQKVYAVSEAAAFVDMTAAAEAAGTAEAEEADAEAEEADESEAEAEATTYTASADGVTVTVTAPVGALPENVELIVTMLDEDSDAYTEAAEAVGYDAGDEGTGMAAMDISFYDGDGLEVEPTAPVSVSIDASALLPEEADAETIEVQHLTETESGVEATLVADATESTAGTVDAETVTAEFEVESFSTFTIKWSNASSSITVYVYDTDGKDISGASAANVTNLSGTLTLSTLASTYVTVPDGYEYSYATVTYTAGQGQSASTTTAKATAVSYSNNRYSVTLDGATSSTSVDSISAIYLYYVNNNPKVSISATNSAVDGPFTLTAKPENFEGTVSYSWSFTAANASGTALTVTDNGDGTYTVKSGDTTIATITVSGDTCTITWAVTGTDYKGYTITASVNATDGTNTATNSYTVTYSGATTSASTISSLTFDHVDVKVTLAESEYSSTNYILYKVSSVTVTTTGGSTTATNSNIYSQVDSEWQFFHGNSSSVSFNSSATITIVYTLYNGDTEKQEEYTAVLTSSSTYADGTYYPADGENAYMLYNYLYGTSYTENTWNSSAHDDIDISGMSIFLVAAILCDGTTTSHSTVTKQSNSIGLDFALDVATLLQNTANFNMDVKKVFEGSDTISKDQFQFNFYDVTDAITVNGSTWSFTLDSATRESTSGATGSDGTTTETVKFDQITYSSVLSSSSSDSSATKTYYYIITETDGNDSSVTYDNTIYGVAVTVRTTKTSTGSGSSSIYTTTVESITYYKLEETETSGTYSATAITADSGNGVSTSGSKTVFTFTNTYQEETTSITLKKVDSEKGTALDGAVFTLSTGSTTDGYTVDGSVTIENLTYGTEYTLTETTAPDGYNLLTEPIKFTVNSNGTVTFNSGANNGNVATYSTDASGNITITVKNEAGYVLPSTGGSGTWLYTLTGLTLCGAALVLWKRRETD